MGTIEDKHKAARTIRRRRILVGLLVVGAVACSLLAALFLSLRLGPGRQAILRWTVAAVEQSTGLRVILRDFWPSLPTGELVLVDIEVRAPEGSAA